MKIYKHVLWLILLSLINQQGAAQNFSPLKCYQIINKATNKALEVKDASQDDGTFIQQSTISTLGHQFWSIGLDDGTYFIMSSVSNAQRGMNALDCTEGGQVKNNSFVGIEQSRWLLEVQTDGTYKIRSVACNKYLSVSSSTDPSVRLKTDLASDLFKWIIKEGPCPPCGGFNNLTLSMVNPDASNNGRITITTPHWSESLTAASSINDGPLTVGKSVYSNLGPGTYKIRITDGGFFCENSTIVTLVRDITSTCIRPDRPIMVDMNNNIVTFTWNKVVGAVSYDWEIRRPNNVDVKSGNTTNNTVTSALPVPLPGESSLNGVDIIVRARCESSVSEYSDPLFAFKTCTDVAVITGGNSVNVGSTLSLTGTTTRTVPEFWASSDTNIAAVSSTGLVRGKKVGSVTITYTLKDRLGFCYAITTKTITVKTASSTFDPTKCYRLVNKATNKVLEVKGGSTAEGAQIFQWALVNNRSRQLWQIKTLSTGKYNIVSKNSGKLMDAPDCTQGAIIKQYAADGTNSQNWALEKQSDGSYKIKNLTCNTYIRVEGSNPANGREVGIKNDFGSDAFKWFVQEANCATGAALSATAETFGFEARASEGRAKLQWITNTGYKNDYFEIERLNANGNFDILGRQNAYVGDDMKSYTFTDNDPLDGDNFYRINSISNGNTPPQYSEVKKVSFSKNDGISIFPNPADEFINVDLRKYEGKTVSLSVYNSVGLLVKKQTIEKVSAAPQQIDVQGFGTGSYLLRVQSEGKREVTRLFHIAK